VGLNDLCYEMRPEIVIALHWDDGVHMGIEAG
jgi:hypothetical protein